MRLLTSVILGATLLVAVPAVGRAQIPGDAATVRPIRIEGYWNRNASSPKVLDTVTFTDSKGGSRRVFGVTALQAYKPEEEGPQVLRHTSLEPGLRLLGGEEMVRKFMDAPETARVVAYGVYRPGTGTITLTSVDVLG